MAAAASRAVQLCNESNVVSGLALSASTLADPAPCGAALAAVLAAAVAGLSRLASRAATAAASNARGVPCRSVFSEELAKENVAAGVANAVSSVAASALPTLPCAAWAGAAEEKSVRGLGSARSESATAGVAASAWLSAGAGAAAAPRMRSLARSASSRSSASIVADEVEGARARRTRHWLTGLWKLTCTS